VTEVPLFPLIYILKVLGSFLKKMKKTCFFLGGCKAVFDKGGIFGEFLKREFDETCLYPYGFFGDKSF